MSDRYATRIESDPLRWTRRLPIAAYVAIALVLDADGAYEDMYSGWEGASYGPQLFYAGTKTPAEQARERANIDALINAYGRIVGVLGRLLLIRD